MSFFYKVIPAMTGTRLILQKGNHKEAMEDDSGPELAFTGLEIVLYVEPLIMT